MTLCSLRSFGLVCSRALFLAASEQDESEDEDQQHTYGDADADACLLSR
jgi:hypothetical protein